MLRLFSYDRTLYIELEISNQFGVVELERIDLVGIFCSFHWSPFNHDGWVYVDARIPILRIPLKSLSSVQSRVILGTYVGVYGNVCVEDMDIKCDVMWCDVVRLEYVSIMFQLFCVQSFIKSGGHVWFSEKIETLHFDNLLLLHPNCITLLKPMGRLPFQSGKGMPS